MCLVPLSLSTPDIEDQIAKCERNLVALKKQAWVAHGPHREVLSSLAVNLQQRVNHARDELYRSSAQEKANAA